MDSNQNSKNTKRRPSYFKITTTKSHKPSSSVKTINSDAANKQTKLKNSYLILIYKFYDIFKCFFMIIYCFGHAYYTNHNYYANS